MAKTDFIVKKEDTLLSFLIQYSGLNKNACKDLIGKGQVSVNGTMQRKANFILNENDQIHIGEVEQEKRNDAPFEILYEDEDLIAIDKPSGLLSMASESEKEKTAYHLVREYLVKKDRRARVFIVHRLDRDTSGVLVFAKNEEMKKLLQDNWNDLMKVRGYIALVDGRMEKESGKLKHYLSESKTQHVYVSNAKEGKLAITNYKVLKNMTDCALVELNLETGRKNQIRVQMAQISHPLVGDKKYNPNPQRGRLCLHAHQLVFVHPKTQKEIKIEAKIPQFIGKKR